MSLPKIPFIIASALGVHCTTMSPSKPPLSEEKVVLPTPFESFVSWCLRLYGLELLRMTVWAASLTEVAGILLAHIDHSQIPGAIYDTQTMRLLSSLNSAPITPTFLFGSLAVAIAGAVRHYCALTLGKFWSFELSVRREHRLVTSGPYSVVRHPSYAAYVLQYAGLAVMYGSQGSWLRESEILQMPIARVLAAMCFFMFTAGVSTGIRRVPMEDRILHGALGEEWENWAKRVKYRLIPGVY